MKYQDLTNLRIEEIYRQYYDSHDALIIEPVLQDAENISMIYCSGNAADYISDLFREYRDELNGKQVKTPLKSEPLSSGINGVFFINNVFI